MVTCDSLQTTSLPQFQTLARQALALLPTVTNGDDANSNGVNDTTEEWYVDCFPQPRRRLPSAAPQQPQSLLECGIRHQDRILLVVVDRVATTTKTSAPRVASPGNKAPPRRKAAMAATEAMAAANTFASLPQVPNRKTTTTMKRTSPTKNTANRHFAQLERRIADDGTGPRRLRDGAIVVGTTGTTTTRRTPTRKRSKMTPHGDGSSSSSNSGTNWIEGLVSSTTDRTTSARTMRQGWRQAVESAYEQNQASARVAAAEAQCNTTTNTHHHPPIEWTRTTITTDTAGSSQPPQQ